MLRSTSRISTQLQIAIWGAVALTMCASLVGWLSFNSVGDVQTQVNEGSIPDIVASFAIAQDTGKAGRRCSPPDGCDNRGGVRGGGC